jgi:hypothetical protein
MHVIHAFEMFKPTAFLHGMDFLACRRAVHPVTAI